MSKTVNSLHIIAALIIRDVVRRGSYTERHNCYPVPSSSKWDVVCFCRYVIQPQPRMNFLSPCALISEMICSRTVALHCATGNFCAWRVPLHNDERKHNLISTFIYRTDCSNGVITISSAPCYLSPCLPHSLSLVLLLLLSCLFIPWRMHLKPCKWEQVNKWMFHECFYDEKMQMRMSEWMNV